MKGDKDIDILQQITLLREERGWSDYRLAKEAGIPHSTLSNLYKRANAPSITTPEAICRAFGVLMSQLFAGTDGNNTLTQEQKGLLKKWVLLSTLQKEKVMAYILELLQK